MSVTYQIRLDEETKRLSFEVFRELWMTPADGIRIFLRKVARTRSIPFSMNIPNEETKKVMADSDAGVNLRHAKDTEDLFNQLGI